MKLSKAQKTALIAAANRIDGSIFPMPKKLPGNAEQRVIKAMAKKGLVAQISNERVEITPLGKIAIGSEAILPMLEYKPTPKQPRAGSKAAWLIKLMRRPQGVTLEQIMAATLWQRHSVRGAISGTIQKRLGWKVISEKNEKGQRVYRIDEGANA
ncbi:DUF3489 domain-containing protein [Magnetococcales bacterium HHB-1]